MGSPEDRRQHREDPRERPVAHLCGAPRELADAAHHQCCETDAEQPPEGREEALEIE
jgi:hypothetical protein